MRIDPTQYDVDKTGSDRFFRQYERHFEHLADREIALLELGIKRGGSLVLWSDFFPKGRIVGLDVNPSTASNQGNRIRTYQGFQQDTALLDAIAAENAPHGFDIIIDDCAHIGEFAAISFRHLFDRHLKPGGIFVIEDWGTGYWKNWPDGNTFRKPTLGNSMRSVISRGIERRLSTSRSSWQHLADGLLHRIVNHLGQKKFRSHEYGMVGLVKQIVDECAIEDITNPQWGIPPQEPAHIEEILIAPGQVFIFKRGV